MCCGISPFLPPYSTCNTHMAMLHTHMPHSPASHHYYQQHFCVHRACQGFYGPVEKGAVASAPSCPRTQLATHIRIQLATHIRQCCAHTCAPLTRLPPPPPPTMARSRNRVCRGIGMPAQPPQRMRDVLKLNHTNPCHFCVLQSVSGTVSPC